MWLRERAGEGRKRPVNECELARQTSSWQASRSRRTNDEIGRHVREASRPRLVIVVVALFLSRNKNRSRELPVRSLQRGLVTLGNADKGPFLSIELLGLWWSRSREKAVCAPWPCQTRTHKGRNCRSLWRDRNEISQARETQGQGLTKSSPTLLSFPAAASLLCPIIFLCFLRRAAWRS